MDKAAFVLFFMGCGFLLPWNAFVMESGYFDELYPGQHIIATFAAWNMGSLVSTQALLVIWGPKFPVGCRVVSGFGLLLLALLLAIPTEDAAMHVLLVVILAVGDAVVQGSVYGFAGQISPFHTSAVMSGNGASGTLVSLLSLATAGAIEDNHKAFVAFFTLCAIQITMCILSWFYMRTLAEAKDLRRTFSGATWTALCCPHKLKKSDVEQSVEMHDADELGAMDTKADEQEENKLVGESVDEDGGAAEQESTVFPGDERDKPREAEPMFTPRSLNRMKLKKLEDHDAEPVQAPAKNKCIDVAVLWAMLKVIRVPASMVCLNFIITLSMFPGLTVEFKDRDGWNETDGAAWYPMLLTTMYNFADMVGRMLFMFLPDQLSPTRSRVLWLTLPRIGFIPVLVGVWTEAVVIPNLMGLLLMFAFGLTNGVAATAAMVYAPMRVTNEDGKEVASILMTFFLMTGLAIGAAIGSGLTSSSGH